MIKSERITYLIFAADVKVIFVIPSEVFFNYRDRHPVGAVKNGGEDFSIQRVKDEYIRHESKCKDEDLTKYFISI